MNMCRRSLNYVGQYDGRGASRLSNLPAIEVYREARCTLGGWFVWVLYAPKEKAYVALNDYVYGTYWTEDMLS